MLVSIGYCSVSYSRPAAEADGNVTEGNDYKVLDQLTFDLNDDDLMLTDYQSYISLSWGEHL